VTNSDGSVTTTTTLADGTQVTLTSPAASSTSSTSGTASSSYTYMEQAIQRAAQSIAASAVHSLSVSA
jgi:hypothetical protein